MYCPFCPNLADVLACATLALTKGTFSNYDFYDFWCSDAPIVRTFTQINWRNAWDFLFASVRLHNSSGKDWPLSKTFLQITITKPLDIGMNNSFEEKETWDLYHCSRQISHSLITWWYLASFIIRTKHLNSEHTIFFGCWKCNFS